MKVVAILALVVALLAGLLGAGLASAQGEELSLLSESVESRFPDGVLFQVTAAGPSPINDVRVFLKVDFLYAYTQEASLLTNRHRVAS